MVHTDLGNIISCGVDWITLMGTTEPRLPNLKSLASELVTIRLRSGFKRKGWGMSGFSGFQSLGVQYGTRGNELIVRLSGDYAHLMWRKAYEMAESCTRIDLECTSVTDDGPARRVTRAFNASRRYCGRTKNGPAVTVVSCTTGGTTCYLGKRQSMQYGRIYDKDAESGDKRYRGAVRYEVEYKGDYAKRLGQRLAASTAERPVITKHLQSFFASRGIELSLSDEHCLSLGAPVIRSDHRGELRWLATQVRPTVQRLIAANMATEVFEALGFGESSDSTLDHLGHMDHDH